MAKIKHYDKNKVRKTEKYFLKLLETTSDNFPMNKMNKAKMKLYLRSQDIMYKDSTTKALTK